jgi:hypothetical protein
VPQHPQRICIKPIPVFGHQCQTVIVVGRGAHSAFQK